MQAFGLLVVHDQRGVTVGGPALGVAGSRGGEQEDAMDRHRVLDLLALDDPVPHRRVDAAAKDELEMFRKDVGWRRRTRRRGYPPFRAVVRPRQDDTPSSTPPAMMLLTYRGRGQVFDAQPLSPRAAAVPG